MHDEIPEKDDHIEPVEDNEQEPKLDIHPTDQETILGDDSTEVDRGESESYVADLDDEQGLRDKPGS